MAEQDTKKDPRLPLKWIIWMLFAWVVFLSLPWVALRAFPPRTEKEVRRIESVLGQLGTYGDLFGMLNCLFTGGAMIGAAYAVILQRRQLDHQREEMARAQEERERTAEWERQAAMFNAISSLAQMHAARLKAFSPDSYNSIYQDIRDDEVKALWDTLYAYKETSNQAKALYEALAKRQKDGEP
jgi:hypothetical protein